MPNLFEGPEKKLEVILHRPAPGLRDNRDGRWDRVVTASRAHILSRVASAGLDAYLLSESSLFVWDDRVLMITCGQTTLIEALPEIVGLVGRDNVAMVFYERKNLMFPDRQPAVADFEAEVSRIERVFPGKSYRLGPANHDHVHVFFSSHARLRPEQDLTLQVLMSALPPELMDVFDPRRAGDAVHSTELAGLDRLLPSMRTDAYLFQPYGYSLNGIRDAEYFTVHVTPQPESSYASFETNTLSADYGGLLGDLLALFRPGRFSLVLTSSMDQRCAPLHKAVCRPYEGYAVTEKSLYEFDCGYGLTFLNLVRDAAAGTSP